MNLTDTIGKKTLNKIKWRLLPFLALLYIINMIDRGNLAFAALTMNKELGISPTAFGWLTSMFFIPYFFLEVPSNMALNKFGARKWIARIMVTWGAVTMLAMFCQDYIHIAAVRILLGAAEAGFFPGVVFYLTLWFPNKERTKVLALFMLAMPLSGIISSPVSGWLLDAVNWGGLSGWRWLFFFEGLPAVICGILCLFLLPNNPKEARFLSDEEKNWLTGVLEEENAQKKGAKRVKFKEMFSDAKVWRIGIIYFFQSIAVATAMTWMAIVIKDFSKASNTGVGLLGMIPSLFGLIALPIAAWHSDKTQERKWHAVAGVALMMIGAFMTAFAPTPFLKMTGLVVLSIGQYTNIAAFWTIPTLFLTGASAAIGTAVINSLNSLGGFAAGPIAGVIKTNWGSNGVMVFIGIFYAVAIVCLATLKLNKPSDKLADMNK